MLKNISNYLKTFNMEIVARFGINGNSYICRYLPSEIPNPHEPVELTEYEKQLYDEICNSGLDLDLNLPIE